MKLTYRHLESFRVVRFDLGSRKSWAGSLLMLSDLRPLIQGQTRIAKLMLITQNFLC